jgi:hypothetical protein
MATTLATASGKSAAKARDCIPPIDEPIVVWSFSTPRWRSIARCAVTMSSIVRDGKASAYGRPVRGSFEAGPVDPAHPPRTFEQTTKNRSVSRARPGPMNSSHQPRPGASSWLRAWDPGESPVVSRTALSRAGDSRPQVS